jgi:hypothetical protein
MKPVEMNSIDYSKINNSNDNRLDQKAFPETEILSLTQTAHKNDAAQDDVCTDNSSKIVLGTINLSELFSDRDRKV